MPICALSHFFKTDLSLLLHSSELVVALDSMAARRLDGLLLHSLELAVLVSSPVPQFLPIPIHPRRWLLPHDHGESSNPMASGFVRVDARKDATEAAKGARAMDGSRGTSTVDMRKILYGTSRLCLSHRLCRTHDPVCFSVNNIVDLE